MNDEEDAYKEEFVDREDEIERASRKFVAWTVIVLLIILVGVILLGMSTSVMVLPNG